MHAKRVLDMIDNQVRALRKRQLVAGFESGIRQGAYWICDAAMRRWVDPGLQAPLAFPYPRGV